MHIDNGKLVGTYVSDRYSEKGTVTIVLTDGDSTPTREYTRYKYVQTEQLTAIGVAVKDYGAVLVPETTLELFKNGVLNATDFGVFVRFNDEYYSVSLLQLLATIVTAPVEFEENSFDDYPTVTFNATLPPYSVGNAGQVPTVDENGKVGWRNVLPPIESGDAGKVLKVKDTEDGTEWGVGRETDYAYRIVEISNVLTIAYNDGHVPPVPIAGTNGNEFNMYDGRKVIRVSNNIKQVYDLAYYDSDDKEIVYTSGDNYDHTKKLFIRFTWDSGHERYESFGFGAYSNVPTFTGATGGQVLKVKSDATGLEWGSASSALYQHFIKIQITESNVQMTVPLTIVTSKSTKFTKSEFYTFIKNNYNTGDGIGVIECIGVPAMVGSTLKAIVQIRGDTTTDSLRYATVATDSGTISSLSSVSSANWQILTQTIYKIF